MKNGLSDGNNKLVKGISEIMAFNALEKLYYIGIKDNNPTALKHFIQFSGIKNSTVTTNNYIQINNLKISNEQFNSLPKDTILEIEEIISKQIK